LALRGGRAERQKANSTRCARRTAFGRRQLHIHLTLFGCVAIFCFRDSFN
jgi:hypothetical protein